MDQKVSSGDTKQTEESTIEKGIRDSTIPEACDAKTLNGKFKSKSAVSEKDDNLQPKAIDDYTHAQEKKTLSTSDKKEDFFQTNSTQAKSDSTVKNNSETEISKSDDKHPRSKASPENLGNKISHIQNDGSFIVKPTQEDNKRESMDDSQNVKNESAIKEKDAYLSEKFLDKTVAKDGALADSAQLNGKVPCDDTLKKIDNSSLLSEAAKKDETNINSFEANLPEKAKLPQDSEKHEIDHGVSNNEVTSKNGVELKQIIDPDYNYIEAKVKLDYMTTERSEKELEVSKLISDQNIMEDDRDISTHQLASEITSSIVSQAKLTVSESGGILDDKIIKESVDASTDLKKTSDLKDSQMHTEPSSHQIKCEKAQENYINKEIREKESHIGFERSKETVQLEKDTNIDFANPKEIKLEEKEDIKKDENTFFSIDPNLEDQYSVSEHMVEDGFKNQYTKDKDIVEQAIPTEINAKEQLLKLEPEKSKLFENEHFTLQQKEPLKELKSELYEKQQSKEKVTPEDVADKIVGAVTEESKLGKSELLASEKVTQEQTESETDELLSKDLNVIIKNDLSAKEKEVYPTEMKLEIEEQVEKKVGLLEIKVGSEKTQLTDKVVSELEANPKVGEQLKAKEDLDETNKEKEESIPAEKDILEGIEAEKTEQPKIEEKVTSSEIKPEKNEQSVETKQEEVKQNLGMKYTLGEIKPEKELQTMGIKVLPPATKQEKDEEPTTKMKVTPPEIKPEKDKQLITDIEVTPSEMQLAKEKQPATDVKVTSTEVKTDKEKLVAEISISPEKTKPAKENGLTIDMTVIPEITQPANEVLENNVRLETQPAQYKLQEVEKKIISVETKPIKEKLITEMKTISQETEPEKDKTSVAEIKSDQIKLSRTEKDFSEKVMPDKNELHSLDEETLSKRLLTETRTDSSVEPMQEMDKLIPLENTSIITEPKSERAHSSPQEKDDYSIDKKTVNGDFSVIEKEISFSEPKLEKSKVSETETKSTLVETEQKEEVLFVESLQEKDHILQQEEKVLLVRTKQEKDIPPSTENQGTFSNSTSERERKDSKVKSKSEVISENKIDPLDVLKEKDEQYRAEDKRAIVETKEQTGELETTEKKTILVNPKSENDSMKITEKTDLPVVEKKINLSEVTLEKELMKPEEKIVCNKILPGKDELLETENKLKPLKSKEDINKLLTVEEKTDLVETEQLQNKLSSTETETAVNGQPKIQDESLTEEKTALIETEQLQNKLSLTETETAVNGQPKIQDESLTEEKTALIETEQLQNKLSLTETETAVNEQPKIQDESLTEEKTSLVETEQLQSKLSLTETETGVNGQPKIQDELLTEEKTSLVETEQLQSKLSLTETETAVNGQPKIQDESLTEEKTALIETEQLQNKLSLTETETAINGQPKIQDESLTEEKLVFVDSKIEKELKDDKKDTLEEIQAKKDDLAIESTKLTLTEQKLEKEIPQHEVISVETKLTKDEENVITENNHDLVESMPEETHLPVRKEEIVFEGNISEGELITTRKESEKSDLIVSEKETISEKPKTPTKGEKISLTETKLIVSIEPKEEESAKIALEPTENSKTEFRHIAVGIEPRFIRVASSCGEETGIEETNETREIEISDEMVESDEQAATAGAGGTDEQSQMQITEYQHTTAETIKTTDKEEGDFKLNTDDKEKLSLTNKESEKSKEVPEAYSKEKIEENYEETSLTHSDYKVKELSEEMLQTIATKSTQPFVSDAQVPHFDLSITTSSAPKEIHSESTIPTDIASDISMKDKFLVKTEDQSEASRNKEEPTKDSSSKSFISDDKTADEGIDIKVPILPTKDESEKQVKDKPIVSIDAKQVESTQEKIETAVQDDFTLNEVEDIKPVAQFLTEEALKEKENVSQGNEDVQTATKPVEKVAEERITLPEDKDKEPKISSVKEEDKIQSQKLDEIKGVLDTDTAKPKVDKPEDKSNEPFERKTAISKPLEQKEESFCLKDQQENKSLKDHSEFEKAKTEGRKVVEDKTDQHGILPRDSTVTLVKQDNQQQEVVLKKENEAKDKEYEEMQPIKEARDHKDKSDTDKVKDKYVLPMPVDSLKGEIPKEETQVTAALEDKELVGETTTRNKTGKIEEPKHDENNRNIDRGTEKQEDKEPKLEEKHILQQDISTDISDAKEVKLQGKTLPGETLLKDTEKVKETISVDEHKEDKPVISYKEEQIKTSEVEIAKPVKEELIVTSHKVKDEKDIINKKQLTTLKDKDLVKEPEEKQTLLEAKYPLVEKTDHKTSFMDSHIANLKTEEKLISIEDDKPLQKEVVGEVKSDSTPSSVPSQLAEDKDVAEDIIERTLKEEPSILSEDAFVSIKKPETEVLPSDSIAAKEPAKQPLEDSYSQIDLKQEVDEKPLKKEHQDILIHETGIKLQKSEDELAPKETTPKAPSTSIEPSIDEPLPTSPTKETKVKEQPKQSVKSPTKPRPSRTPPKTLPRKEVTDSPEIPKSKTPTSPIKRLSHSPKKAPLRNGIPSPTKYPQRLPPIKASVGQAPMPNLRNVKSKIGSLDNIKYKPSGGEKKQLLTKKLEWVAAPRVGSLENTTYKPGGGVKKITTQKLEWKVEPKVGDKNIGYSPGGGQVKHGDREKPASVIESRKLEWKQKASSKVGSMDNVKHKPGGGQTKVKSEKIPLKDKVSSKVGSLSSSEKASRQGSETKSPIPPSSPQFDEQSQLPPSGEHYDEEPTETDELEGEATNQKRETAEEDPELQNDESKPEVVETATDPESMKEFEDEDDITKKDEPETADGAAPESTGVEADHKKSEAKDGDVAEKPVVEC